MSFPQFIAPLDPANVPIRRCPVPRARASRRFLIVRLGSHGDILMATPLLAALRAAYPDCWLTWMVEHTNREAVDANPYVDELIIWDGRFWKDLLSERWKNMVRSGRMLGFTWLRHALKMRHQLRLRRFDVFVNFHGEQWPTLARHVGAPARIGVFDIFPEFNPPRPEYRRFYTTTYGAEVLPPHRTDIHLLPLRALGLPPTADKSMFLGYTAEDVVVVDTFLRDSAIVGRFIVVAPKTTWESRNWPEERFAELGDRLAQETGGRVVLIGSDQERSDIERIASRMQTNPARTAGLLSFRQMAALIGRSSLLVSGDTGPMHVSAAVGAPYVALFGSTPIAGRAPLSGLGLALAHPVPCGPCDKMHCRNTDDPLRCLRLISVAEVVAAAARLLPAAV